jgi:hypothetical protein
LSQLETQVDILGWDFALVSQALFEDRDLGGEDCLCLDCVRFELTQAFLQRFDPVVGVALRLDQLRLKFNDPHGLGSKRCLSIEDLPLYLLNQSDLSLHLLLDLPILRITFDHLMLGLLQTSLQFFIFDPHVLEISNKCVVLLL